MWTTPSTTNWRGPLLHIEMLKRRLNTFGRVELVQGGYYGVKGESHPQDTILIPGPCLRKAQSWECAESVAHLEELMADRRRQAGLIARLNIELGIVDDIVEGNPVALMDYWGSLHDKVQALAVKNPSNVALNALKALATDPDLMKIIGERLDGMDTCIENILELYRPT